ncbi:uncharacterized protein MYCFIDRAFT_172229 [Pseudocercospora fijiensis CIRAD86]|uniref:Uncharacterized protein n=1 Tax=Pseudocercospora fijiensis (strain CIRAD86) TaxID=383855 RepID=M3A5T4_PSEFD|nr:uncharacterized protein MYCFIDRAFT_172229 [Pseudocercospora fijiensis CIRAD86]EME86484.1 hypothetical protein MYCFIDRAFT_172229 [Pseudocercospora fijiensis CIRAD86]
MNTDYSLIINYDFTGWYGSWTALMEGVTRTLASGEGFQLAGDDPPRNREVVNGMNIAAPVRCVKDQEGTNGFDVSKGFYYQPILMQSVQEPAWIAVQKMHNMARRSSLRFPEPELYSQLHVAIEHSNERVLEDPVWLTAVAESINSVRLVLRLMTAWRFWKIADLSSGGRSSKFLRGAVWSVLSSG